MHDGRHLVNPEAARILYNDGIARLPGTPIVKRTGLLYGLAAYTWWGLMPLYFERVQHVPALEILAHRIVWSFLLLAVITTCLRRWDEVKRCLVDPVARLHLCGTTILIAVNWLAYIYGVVERKVVLASLGYFILPLVSILLGTLLLGERLKPLQWLAVALAGCGVVCFVAGEGQWPWLSLVIAVSFGLYGLLRKRIDVDGMTGLTVETLLLCPPCAAYLLWLAWQGKPMMGSDRTLDVLLLLSCVVTTVPLFCFGEAARRLPLSTLGFLQYLSPTLQLILGVTRLNEPFGTARQVGFAFIWAGLAVFSFASLRQLRRQRRAAELLPAG